MNATSWLEFLFGCHHNSPGRAFTIGRRTYCVCCECGAEFDYSLENMAINREPSGPPPATCCGRPEVLRSSGDAEVSL